MSIKKGDLVMVVKPTPCCGNTARVGQVFAVLGRAMATQCRWCGSKDYPKCVVGEGFYVIASRLKKLDPPSEGETREAYVNLKQPTKETA